MFWILYNALFALIFILLLPRFFMRMRRRGGYRRHFMQRFGSYGPEHHRKFDAMNRPVWVHAVSVGEVQVAMKFMSLWRKEHPDAGFVLSVTTSTAHRIAEEKCGADDAVIYFPVDFPPVMSRVARRLNPGMLVLVESEIWPNLVRIMHRRGAPVFLINGRLSDRSWRRMKKVRPLTRRILPLIDLFCMQSEEERRRMIALGAPADRVQVLNSAKYEVAERSEKGERSARAVIEQAGIGEQHRVLLGGSTWPGEERVLLDLFRRLRETRPELRLVLVPRHVERVPELLREIGDEPFRMVRRSEVGAGTNGSAEVFILDTTGELMNFYGVADLVFVGKSLCERGGQNIMEPACFGKPVVVGPNMQNFPRVMKDFLAADAICQVADAEGLQVQIDAWLAHPDVATGQGERAGALMREKAGALTRTVELIGERLENRDP